MVDGLGLDDRRKAERRQEETRDGRQADLAAAAATRCVFGRVSRVALTLLALRLATVRFVKTNVFLKVRLLGEAGVAVHVGASERLLAGVLVANMVLQVVAAVERLVAMAFSPLAEEPAPLFPAIQGLLGLDVRIRDMKPERFYIIECSRAIPKHSLVKILRNNFFCFVLEGEVNKLIRPLADKRSLRNFMLRAGHCMEISWWRCKKQQDCGVPEERGTGGSRRDPRACSQR